MQTKIVIEQPIIAAHAGQHGVIMDRRDGSFDTIPFGISSAVVKPAVAQVTHAYPTGRWTGTTHNACKCHH